MAKKIAEAFVAKLGGILVDEARGVLAAKAQDARVGTFEQADEIEKQSFAGSVGTTKSHKLAALNLHRDVSNGNGTLAVPHGQGAGEIFTLDCVHLRESD